MNLLIHQAALGDWALTLPILRALAPQPTLVVTHGSKARLAARLFPHVQAHDIEDQGWSALFMTPGPPPSQLQYSLAPPVRQALADACRIISFVSGGQDAWAQNIRPLAPQARLYFVAPRPPEDWRDHVCAWHAHQLRAQGLDLQELAGTDAGAVRRNPAGPVVVHPGSGSPGKCWPAQRFDALIHALRQHRLPVQPILGEVEVDTWPAPLRDHWTHELGAAQCDSLNELADILERARLYVGNDSGPTHLAAQMGVPTLALFGPTSVTRWRPRGPSAAVLAPPAPTGMEWLGVEVVLRSCFNMTNVG